VCHKFTHKMHNCNTEIKMQRWLLLVEASYYCWHITTQQSRQIDVSTVSSAKQNQPQCISRTFSTVMICPWTSVLFKFLMAFCASAAVAKTMKPKHFEPGLFALVTTFAVTTYSATGEVGINFVMEHLWKIKNVEIHNLASADISASKKVKFTILH